MNVDAFRPICGDMPIKVVPCGIAGDDWPVIDRDRDRPFRFLMAGTMVTRKVPYVLLGAWRELKKEKPEFDAELVMHTTEPTNLLPAAVEAFGPDVILSNKMLSRAELIDLYADCDVLVSPSRGEGNNKPAMEFMATGGTVIASDWSGHQNWLHPDHAFPVCGRLETAWGAPDAVEFAIDPQALKQTLWEAWADRKETRAKGQRAQQFVRTALDWKATVPHLVRFIEQQL
jgi:glycosyltransferase involved in cell wall biosynthesis